ncbi:MAG: ABC transporter substrate-binding protein [Syntrophorhabdales bacterium]|jgi:NitT/TauT family transport system substrate-binding protein
MMKSLLLWLSLVSFLWIGSASQAAVVERVSISLGLLPVIDTLPLIVAEKRGFFEEQGIEARFLYFSSALERDVALQSGKVDAYFGDLLNTLLLINSGQRLAILTSVMRTDPRQRMFALLASPQSKITDVRQLAGESVAISKASVIEYVLDGMLSGSAVRPDRVRKMEVRAIPIRYQMLMAGQVKSALLPEPLATKAESEGARVLADDRALNTTLTVVALKRDLLSRYPSLPARFVAAYDRAVRAIEENPDAFMDLLVERTQFPASLKGRFRVPLFPRPEKPRRQDVLSISKWLKEKGLISTTAAYETIVAPW